MNGSPRLYSTAQQNLVMHLATRVEVSKAQRRLKSEEFRWSTSSYEPRALTQHEAPAATLPRLPLIPPLENRIDRVCCRCRLKHCHAYAVNTQTKSLQLMCHGEIGTGVNRCADERHGTMDRANAFIERAVEVLDL
jgi:hypothetical protein